MLRVRDLAHVDMLRMMKIHTGGPLQSLMDLIKYPLGRRSADDHSPPCRPIEICYATYRHVARRIQHHNEGGEVIRWIISAVL